MEQEKREAAMGLYEKCQRQKREVLSINMIQRIYRGHLGRKAARRWCMKKAELEAMAALLNASVVNIQRVYRGHRGREEAREARMEIAEFINRMRTIDAVEDEQEYVGGGGGVVVVVVVVVVMVMVVVVVLVDVMIVAVHLFHTTIVTCCHFSSHNLLLLVPLQLLLVLLYEVLPFDWILITHLCHHHVLSLYYYSYYYHYHYQVLGSPSMAEVQEGCECCGSGLGWRVDY